MHARGEESDRRRSMQCVLLSQQIHLLLIRQCQRVKRNGRDGATVWMRFTPGVIAVQISTRGVPGQNLIDRSIGQPQAPTPKDATGRLVEFKNFVLHRKRYFLAVTLLQFAILKNPQNLHRRIRKESTDTLKRDLVSFTCKTFGSIDDPAPDIEALAVPPKCVADGVRQAHKRHDGQCNHITRTQPHRNLLREIVKMVPRGNHIL